MGLWLGQRVQASSQRLDVDTASKTYIEELVRVTVDVGTRQLGLKQYAAADNSYREALALVECLTNLTPAKRGDLQASIYHNLGSVAQEQRQWAQAEQHYQQALVIHLEYQRPLQSSQYLPSTGDCGRGAAAVDAGGAALPAGAGHLPSSSTTATARPAPTINWGWWRRSSGSGRRRSSTTSRRWPSYIEFNDRYEQAGTYHQLGAVAQEQRQWAQAEQHYQQALAIFIEFNDRYSQATTYHQLGSVAQEQRQWAQAEQHHQQALAIYIEFNDRYSQASTYHNLGTWRRSSGSGRRRSSTTSARWPSRSSSMTATARPAPMVSLATSRRRSSSGCRPGSTSSRPSPSSSSSMTLHNEAGTYHQMGGAAQEQQQWSQARQDTCCTHSRSSARLLDDEHNMLVTLRTIVYSWRDSGDTTLPAATAEIWRHYTG